MKCNDYTMTSYLYLRPNSGFEKDISADLIIPRQKILILFESKHVFICLATIKAMQS